MEIIKKAARVGEPCGLPQVRYRVPDRLSWGVVAHSLMNFYQSFHQNTSKDNAARERKVDTNGWKIYQNWQRCQVRAVHSGKRGHKTTKHHGCRNYQEVVTTFRRGQSPSWNFLLRIEMQTLFSKVKCCDNNFPFSQLHMHTKLFSCKFLRKLIELRLLMEVHIWS